MSTVSDQKSAPGQSILGVKRALDVLTLFGEDGKPTLGVTEIAERLSLSKAVVHRILTELRASGFVEIDPDTRRYFFGPQVLVLGLRYLDGLDARAVAHDAMVALAGETGETATFSVRTGFERVYIDQVTPDRDVKMVVQLGRRFPLHTGASSKAMLAWTPEAECEEYITQHELVALTPRSITDPGKLRQELVAIRKRGYATSLGERDSSAGSVAAPIFGYAGSLVGVISVSGPIERFRAEMDQAAQVLLRATDAVSRRLGYRGQRPAQDGSNGDNQAPRPPARATASRRRR